uniref:Uncharacterized protein n=1 Tax=Amorphochlora amoebiformis TaxID=1561963 RepID=A0A7S0H9D5_9EUKA|mmetsp:Transcript_7852/g.12200  ORF Transcript_7852/g.12200 Transcript_7852/m.12200 type:complete len:574 (+) Transcript_7852:58-1779(+)
MSRRRPGCIADSSMALSFAVGILIAMLQILGYGFRLSPDSSLPTNSKYLNHFSVDLHHKLINLTREIQFVQQQIKDNPNPTLSTSEIIKKKKNNKTDIAHGTPELTDTRRHFLEIESLESVKIRENEPKVLILTTSKRSTTRMQAADMVDNFLSRHSIYQIHQPEPSSDKDPLIWTLELLPHPELEVYRALDRLQHDQASGNCAANGQSKYWCSGWHADLWYAARGSLNLALTNNRPLSLVFPDVCKESHKKFVKAWHYAADACEAKDLSCYFLNYTSCPRPEKFDKSKEMFDLKRTIPDKFESLFSNHHALKGKSTVKLWDVHNAAPGEFYNFLLYMYLTRMRYWVRQEVMKRVEEFKLKEPCAVMHVRQNDIALHDNWRRFYYPLSAYIGEAKDAIDAMGIKTIFLMTDSGDVIDETKKHPEFEWRWMEKHRFRRNEKINFENQFPSGSPKEESIALLTLFHLASECRLFIGGVSGFGTLAYRYMCLLHTKNVWDCPPHRVVDQHKAYTGMHDNPDPRHNKSSEHFGKKAVKYSGYTETDKEGVPYPEEVKGSPEHKQMQNHKKEEAKRQK